MQSTRFRNVVIFGDSLSDTGIMARTMLGKLSSKIGAMTVSPTGRFSDCRNWTDHMFEAATNGQSLVMANASISKKLSKKHQSFSRQSRWGKDTDPWFRYANYSVGGATGHTPYNILYKATLTTMKDEIKAFKNDYLSQCFDKKDNFLFIIWFGANDLYTAGRPSAQMSAVAEKIARKRRKEITDIVGLDRAKFIYINMGLPLSAARYQRSLKTAREEYEKKTNEEKSITSYCNSRMEINNFESGAMLFNYTLKQITQSNGDVCVDMAPLLTQESMSKLLKGLHLVDGVQTSGTSNRFIDGCNYDIIMGNKSNISTSDEAHPTDRVYRVIWEKVRETLWVKGYTFGTLPVRR